MGFRIVANYSDLACDAGARRNGDLNTVSFEIVGQPAELITEMVR